MADEPETLVLPDTMRPLIDLVVATMSQWRMAGGGMAPMRAVALDLVAVDIAARWLGIVIDPPMFRDLQAIEREALVAMRSER